MSRRVLGGITVVLLVAWLVRAFLGHRAAGPPASPQPSAASQSTRLAATGGPAAIILDSATDRRIGIATAVLRPLRRPGEVSLTGEIVSDPGATATVRAPVAGRLTIPPGTRWPAFGERVSAGTLLGQVSDALPLAVPREGMVSRVLAQAGEMVQAGQALLEISDYRHPLARIAWSTAAPTQVPATVLLAPLGARQKRTLARLVGPAPEVDPLTRQPAFLFRAEAEWPGARPGAPVVASLPDPHSALHGVFVPSEAVVQWDGLTWAFVQHGPSRYLRTPVSTERPVPGGWLDAGELRSGDSVVVRGAQQLLSEEFRAKIVVGEEMGE